MLKYIVGAGLLLFILLCIGWWSGKRLKLHRYTFQNRKVTEDLHGLSIVQISDLHCFRFGREQENLIRVVRQARPDLIAITGDLFDRHRKDVHEPSFELVFAMLKIAPVFYVNGNHETAIPGAIFWEGDMRSMGVRVLRNEAADLTVGETSLRIVGLCEDARPEQWTMLIDSTRLHILLAHRPERFKEYMAAGVDLALCGHTHGGLMRILGIGLYAPEQGIFPRYTRGKYSKQRTTMIVSAGLGNTRYAPRLFNPREVVAVTLQSVR
ncbi:MAG: metallophosphoesterase [Clostridiales bacterium]|nr:metallophosphoesterase [Clostridiales bacterium]